MPAELLQPLLVGEPEARRLLGGLCAKTMYNLRALGELPGVKIGSRIMYDVTDLRAFIDCRKGPGVSNPRTTPTADPPGRPEPMGVRP